MIKLLYILINSLKTQTVPSTLYFSWIYALLIGIDVPIEADFQAKLYELLVICCEIRATSLAIPEPVVAGANTVIALLAYFGQCIID